MTKPVYTIEILGAGIRTVEAVKASNRREAEVLVRRKFADIVSGATLKVLDRREGAKGFARNRCRPRS